MTRLSARIFAATDGPIDPVSDTQPSVSSSHPARPDEELSFHQTEKTSA